MNAGARHPIRSTPSTEPRGPASATLDSTKYPPNVRAALERLAASGLEQSSYAPPLHRSLWQLGINVPPPHFAGFFFNFALAGIFFGVGWGVLMAAFFWLRYATPLMFALPYALAAGVAFGTAMALYFRHGARKHKLPSWSSLLDRVDT